MTELNTSVYRDSDGGGARRGSDGANDSGSSPKDLLKDLLQSGLVYLYCYRGFILDVLVSKKSGGVTVFGASNQIGKQGNVPGIRYVSYKDASDVRLSDADVCLLDGRALKALVPALPGRSRFVLARLAIRRGWIWGGIGLFHRMLKGQVKARGIVRLLAGRKSSLWLVLEGGERENSGPVFISKEAGVQGLLDHLKRERVKHVVLRFYENLPEIQEGGDLDILIADEDEEKLREFAREHPGSLGVDVYGVSSLGLDGLPYYPPVLSKQILENAVDGPRGSRIPGPREAFLSLAYHVLYHKGVEAGVKSSLEGVKVNPNPRHDYVGILKEKADVAGIDVDVTMEELDECLAREGWRPMRDTLVKIADRNEWVRERFLSAEPVREIGLGVFILRKSPHNLEFMEEALEEARKGKFAIVRHKVLDDKEKSKATLHLRGGNWAEKKGLNEEGAFLPAAAVIILDLHFAHLGRGTVDATDYSRLRTFKERLRKRFDMDGVSLVHSTDSTEEAWEYIETVFPNEADEIRREVDKMLQDFRVSFPARVALHLTAFPYYRKKTILKLKKFIVRHAIK